MVPTLDSLQALDSLAESFSPGSQGKYEDFLHTSFTWFDGNDQAYFGRISRPKHQLSLNDISSALELIPNEVICPPIRPPLQKAPDDLNLAPASELRGFYIKRPPIQQYDWYKEEDCVCIIPATLLEEATSLHLISQSQQHPNLVRFHGCRVRNGLITGLILDRYELNLSEFVRERGAVVDTERILAGLDSAIRHLHSLGLAHNDINPSNIMVNEATGDPVLVDFGSCHKIGAKLTATRGTPGWTEEGDDYTVSRESHDTSALEKIRLWFTESTA